ncbi:hypothetical protein C8F01DRAFT_1145134 [Mycena amicta]|nr:hypothetical protein C8F01DRAFT_1145134 [Mycena amicta]
MVVMVVATERMCDVTRSRPRDNSHQADITDYIRVTTSHATSISLSATMPVSTGALQQLHRPRGGRFRNSPRLRSVLSGCSKRPRPYVSGPSEHSESGCHMDEVWLGLLSSSSTPKNNQRTRGLGAAKIPGISVISHLGDSSSTTHLLLLAEVNLSLLGGVSRETLGRQTKRRALFRHLGLPRVRHRLKSSSISLGGYFPGGFACYLLRGSR